MSILNSIASTFGGILAPDDTDVKQTQASLQDAIHSGAIQAAANYGAAGQSLTKQAQAAVANNVSYDPTAVNADSAALAPVQAHYLTQFQNGGLAGKAAVEAAQSQARLNAQGGLAGIHADTLNSAAALNQVANTSQSEINDAGSATNSLNAQQAAVALKKAVFSAQVSHANLLKNLGAQNTIFNIGNSQQQLFNTAQSDLNTVSNSAASTDIDFQKEQALIGAQILQGLVSGGAKGIGTLNDAFGDGNSTDTNMALTNDGTVAGTSANSAGYTLPAPAVSKAVVPSPGLQSTAFTTAPILPNTANAWNGGY